MNKESCLLLTVHELHPYIHLRSARIFESLDTIFLDNSKTLIPDYDLPEKKKKKKKKKKKEKEIRGTHSSDIAQFCQLFEKEILVNELI